MNYFKVKSAELEQRLVLAECQTRADAAVAKRNAVFVAEGLDPQGSYTFSDADETITPVKGSADGAPTT